MLDTAPSCPVCVFPCPRFKLRGVTAARCVLERPHYRRHGPSVYVVPQKLFFGRPEHAGLALWVVLEERAPVVDFVPAEPYVGIAFDPLAQLGPLVRVKCSAEFRRETGSSVRLDFLFGVQAGANVAQSCPRLKEKIFSQGWIYTCQSLIKKATTHQ